MGKLKNAASLFLGVAELNRLNKFLADDGFRLSLLKNSGSFGLVRYEGDSSLLNFKIVEDVSGSGNVKTTADSFAIDSNGAFIRMLTTSGIAITNDSNWYWLKVAYSATVTETGTVSIDTAGNITGTGTKFTEILRGQPFFPSKIAFIGSSSNLLEYEVLEVLSDTSAILSGSFTSESNLSFKIVGTFTPGQVPTTGDKYPFQYDSCTLTKVLETVSNTAPAKTSGTEFYIARVRNVAGTVTIQDKRTEFFKTQAHYNLTNIVRNANPLVGVENIKYQQSATTQDKNILTVGFGLRTTTWTSDLPNRAITFSGNIDCGKFKTTSQFTNGDLDGWRLYYKNGSYEEIVSSVKVGSDFKVILKTLDPDRITAGDLLVVVPAVDEVEIQVIGNSDTIKTLRTIETFKSSEGYGSLLVTVPSDGYTFVVQYRYNKNGDASQWLTIPTDTTNGFYNEDQFDSNGVIVGLPVRTTYTANDVTGFIPFKLSSGAYSNFKASIALGDLLGVDTIAIANTPNDVTLTVGTSRQYQYINGSNYSLNDNKRIILANGLSNGNFFLIHIKQQLLLNGYTFKITNAAFTALKTFTLEDTDFLATSPEGLFIRCEWDGSAWIINNVNETAFVPAGAMVDYPVSTAPKGWLLCNGAAVSRTTYSKLFAVISTAYGVGDGSTTFNLPSYGGRVGVMADGTTEFLTIGQTGGAKTHLLTAAESGVAPHTHSYTLNDGVGNTAASGGFALQNNGTTGSASTNIANASGVSASQAHNNLQPYIVIGGKIIKY